MVASMEAMVGREEVSFKKFLKGGGYDDRGGYGGGGGGYGGEYGGHGGQGGGEF